MYETTIKNKEDLNCFFCGKNIFNDDKNDGYKDGYINYKIVQINKREQYRNKCSDERCDMLFPKNLTKYLRNREMGVGNKLRKIEPNSIIKIRAYNLYF